MPACTVSLLLGHLKVHRANSRLVYDCANSRCDREAFRTFLPTHPRGQLQARAPHHDPRGGFRDHLQGREMLRRVRGEVVIGGWTPI